MVGVSLQYRVVELSLARPFRIAGGTTVTRRSVLIAARYDGLTGYGEAAPARMYGQSADSVTAALPRAADLLCDCTGLPIPADVTAKLMQAFPGELAMVAAIDAALHDLAGKLAGEPVWRRIGADPARMPQTSFTIGIDEPDVIEQKVRDAAGWPVLKIKLGTPEDEQIVRAVRRATSVPLRVDANGGWSLDRARQMCCWLASQNVELVEQPLPRGNEGQLPQLKSESPIPIFADESAHHAGDVRSLRGAVHGVNLKLSKCGGISSALESIRTARECGLRVMVGCMIESTVGIAAAAAVAPLCDVVDLDGHLLLADDLATGLRCCDARLVLTGRAGLGFELKQELVDATDWIAL